jgi:hydroxyacylglutathione hydrolase
MTVRCTIIPVTPYQQNCSLIQCSETGALAVVDPGGELGKIADAIDKLGGNLEKVLLTHGHLDHCAAAALVRDRFSVPIEGPQREDAFWIDQLPQWCAMAGFPPAQPFTPDRWLESGDRVTVGKQELEVLFCPGHTPGHVVFFHRGARVAWVGDVLFQGSIGRTDFPRGNHEQLLSSIRQQLFPLGDDVTFVPGHGPTSTFGQERKTNPFVADHRYG